jgi:hypothetical protein
VATDVAVATDELIAGEMRVDEETHGCLAVAVDVVILCFVVWDELFVPVVVECLELGSQNGGDMCGSCAAAAAAEAEVAAVAAVVVVVVVAAAAAVVVVVGGGGVVVVVVAAAVVVVVVVVAAAAAAVDDKGTVEAVGLRLRQHQERCRCDHQQQYHRYSTRLKMYIQNTST